MATVMPSAEIDRRYRRIREAMARDSLDAVIVAGNEYSGFEGAVTYMSGFVIVHRYAYVLLPFEGDPSIVFPREATYVGEHGTTWIDEQVFVDKPGEWLADQVRGQRVGVYGLDYVMTVRDYRALDGRPRSFPGMSSSTMRAPSRASSSSRPYATAFASTPKASGSSSSSSRRGRPSARSCRTASSTSSAKAAVA